MISKAIAFTFKVYIKDLANVFEVITNLGMFFIMIDILVPNNYSKYNFLKYLALFKLLRLLKLLGHIEEYRIIFNTFTGLLPIYSTLTGIMISTYYIFSLIGV